MASHRVGARLERVQVVPGAVADVARFFEDPENLARITPPWMRFRIVSPRPIVMAVGARIDYTIRLLGLPVRWRTVITCYEPGERFVDEQERGPYRRWRHVHEFEPVAGGTRVRDVVEYDVGFGPLGALVRRWYVAPTLERIFDFRAQAVAALLGPGRPAQAAR